VGTFPKLSESFVLREVRELRRRGQDVTVYSLFPADAREPAPAEAEEVRDAVRVLVPGPRALVRAAGAVVCAIATRPGVAARAIAWSMTWSLRERNPRPLLAFPVAALLARALPGPVHLHAHFANTPATVALLAARLADVPWSFTGHARDLFLDTSPRFLAEKLRSVHFAAVGTEHAARALRAWAPSAANRIAVVRNGLPPTPSTRGGAPAEPPLILAVARLVPKKGLPTLIRACHELRLRGSLAVCEIIGDGPQREDLEGLVVELGLNDRVRVRGAMDGQGVRRAMEQAAVFALPCRVTPSGDTDSLPVALLEAMQAGVPVVTTPIAGIPEVVRDGASGLLVDPEDPVALAHALERVLADGALQRILAAGGRLAVDSFRIETTVSKLVRLFEGESATA
jgi:glycosyltransferase involved in cell wall biosynthesis